MRVGVAGVGLALGALVAGGALAQGSPPGTVQVVHGTPNGPTTARVLDDALGTVDMVLQAGGAGEGARHGRRGKGARRRTAGEATLAVPVAAGVGPGALPVRRGAPLDNAQVLALTRAGLGDAAVTALVQTSGADYDVSTPALIGLRRAGVGSGVIAAMITQQAGADGARVEPDSPDPLQPHPPGVYVLADWLETPQMVAVHALASDRTMVGGFLGYAVAGGMLPVHYNALVPGAHAALMAGARRPTFYVYAGAGVPDPTTLALVRFAVKKDGRVVGIGSVSFAGARNGVPAKQSLPFDVRAVAPGVTAVRPEDDLPPGEYGFVQTAPGIGSGNTVVATSDTRVFDFAVGDAAAVAAHEGTRPRHDAGFARAQGNGPTVAEVMPVALDYLDRLAQPARKQVLSRAEKAASAPSQYPGGK